MITFILHGFYWVFASMVPVPAFAGETCVCVLQGKQRFSGETCVSVCVVTGWRMGRN